MLGKIILASQESWPHTSNQLKFVNRQLYHETASLELQHNRINFMGHRELPTESDGRTYNGALPSSFAEPYSGYPGVGSYENRAGRKFVKFINKVAPSKLCWLSEIVLRSYEGEARPLFENFETMAATNQFCTAHSTCRVTYISRWIDNKTDVGRPRTFSIELMIAKAMDMSYRFRGHRLFPVSTYPWLDLEDRIAKIPSDSWLTDKSFQMVTSTFRIMPLLEDMDEKHFRDIATLQALGDMGPAVAEAFRCWTANGL